MDLDSHIKALYRRGRAYARRSEFEAARADVKEAAKLAPNNRQVCSNQRSQNNMAAGPAPLMPPWAPPAKNSRDLDGVPTRLLRTPCCRSRCENSGKSCAPSRRIAAWEVGP
eukprot:scaffold267609_cov31-Tisochrysis_lutea.AAC.3